MNEGIAVLRSIQAGLGDDVAVIQAEVIPTFDGTNAIVVIQASQALTGVPTLDESFTVGKLDVNGTEIEGVQNIAVDFGITLFVMQGDGDSVPTLIAIDQIAPRATISITKASFLATLGISGVVQGVTDSFFYFRKKDQGGSEVANGVAEHIKFTMDEGMIMPGPSRVNQNGIVVLDVVLEPTFDGTAAPFVINTASTIT